MRIGCRRAIIDRDEENPSEWPFNCAIMLDRDTLMPGCGCELNYCQSLGLFFRQNTVHRCILGQILTTINYNFALHDY